MNRFCFVFGMLLLLLPCQVKSRTDDPDRFETLLNLAEQTSYTDPERAIEYASEALAIGERKQDQKMIARAQMMLASTKYDAQNYTKAIEYCKLCEPFFDKSGDVENLFKLYNILSTAYFYTGNAEMSDMYSDKSIELAKKHPNMDALFEDYYNHGAIAYYRGDYSYAMEFAFKALDIAKKSNQPVYMAHCYDLMGTLSKNMSDYRKAIIFFDLSREIFLAEEDKMSAGRNYINTAVIYEKFKQPDSVFLCYYQALYYFREIESAEGLTLAYTGLARYYMQEGKLDSAKIFIGKGLKTALLSESIKDLFESYHVAGNISFQQGDTQKAMEHYRKALLLASRNRNRESEAKAKLGISRNYAAMQRFDSAYHYLSQAYVINDSLCRNDEIQKRTYAFAEHNVKEQLEKEMEAEKLQQRLWRVIMGLSAIVIAILSLFIRMMSLRQKKIESINAELNKYKSDLEIALKDRTRELILSEQQILNLSNNLPNGAIFRFAFENERKGKMLYVSSGWEELTGQSIEEAKNTVFFFQDRIHPDDSRELLKALAHAIQNHTILDKVYRFYRNNTEMRWFHVRAVAIEDDGLTYLDGYQVDETEQKHFEQELVTAKNKAEESDKLKSAFLANMSHEIRTPMNAIVGFSSLLVDMPLPPERQTVYLELIRDNCQNLLQLIDDIVDISKIEAGQLKLRMETVLLSEIMTAVREHIEPVIADRYPNIELQFDEGLFNSSLTLHTDVFRLKQIFVNLIENALKFTKKGFVKCGLLFDRTDALHFIVVDTGIGIAREDMENIFKSFRKLDQYSGGTGLGLSIVRRVLLQMGGNIWVESEPNVGSAFHFTLPLMS